MDTTIDVMVQHNGQIYHRRGVIRSEWLPKLKKNGFRRELEYQIVKCGWHVIKDIGFDEKKARVTNPWAWS